MRIDEIDIRLRHYVKQYNSNLGAYSLTRINKYRCLASQEHAERHW